MNITLSKARKLAKIQLGRWLKSKRLNRDVHIKSFAVKIGCDLEDYQLYEAGELDCLDFDMNKIISALSLNTNEQHELLNLMCATIKPI